MNDNLNSNIFYISTLGVALILMWLDIKYVGISYFPLAVLIMTVLLLSELVYPIEHW